MSFRPLPWLTALSALALALLVALGAWQWSRMEEKQALGATLARLSTASPAPLARALAEPEEFAPVALPPLPADAPRFALSTFRPEPLAIALAGEGCGLLVQGGEAPVGVLRRAPPNNPWLPADDPDQGVWRQIRPDAMLARYGLRPCAPGWFVAARAGGNPRADPTAQAGFAGPERHFGYALTWWGLALALVGVYVTLHAQQGRLRLGRSP